MHRWTGSPVFFVHRSIGDWSLAVLESMNVPAVLLAIAGLLAGGIAGILIERRGLRRARSRRETEGRGIIESARLEGAERAEGRGTGGAGGGAAAARSVGERGRAAPVPSSSGWRNGPSSAARPSSASWMFSTSARNASISVVTRWTGSGRNSRPLRISSGNASAWSAAGWRRSRGSIGNRPVANSWARFRTRRARMPRSTCARCASAPEARPNARPARSSRRPSRNSRWITPPRPPCPSSRCPAMT